MTTPDNTPVREAASNDLLKYRASGQASIFGLVIQHPVTVYTARINQSFTSLDGITQLTYDGGSGTLADVREGMTVYIGSSAGARDKGELRIRKTPTSSIFYIGETSKIQFANDDYITVVDAFFFHPRLTYNQGGLVRMDSDIDYGDNTRGGSILRAGPIVSVIQSSETVTFTPPNPTLSMAYDGDAITDYLFSAPSATNTNSMDDPENASWEYPATANQEYRWSLKATDNLGKETVTYRRVFVNPADIPFALNSVAGKFDSGDWSFEVTVYSDPGTIYDHALCTLYVNDYHNGALDSIGKLAGYENIVATGWIDGESIEQNSQTGWVTFTVQGPAFWMNKINIDPLELTSMIEDVNIVPTRWTEIQVMTVDKILARVLYWMSTVPLFMDVFFTGDESVIRTFSVAGGSLLSQLQVISDLIFAKPLVNGYGQMFIETDAQVLDSDTWSAMTNVMDITSDDYIEPFEIEKNINTRTAMIELSALQSSDGVNDVYLYSRAPGNSPNELGIVSSYENHVIENQSEVNRITGQLLAVENNPYESLIISFASSIRLFDIAPRMYATITTDPLSNPRGIAFTEQKLIPRSVSYSVSENGSPKTVVTFEVKAAGVNGVSYFPPTLQDDNLDSGLDDFGDLDFPSGSLFPETVPEVVSTPCNSNMGNHFTLTFSPRVITGSTSTRISRAYFPCKIRATGGFSGDTYIQLQYAAQGDAEGQKTCYAVNGDTRVLTGTWSGNRITFSPVSDTEITGFEIEINEGAGSIISAWALGNLLETGDMGDPTTQCIEGNYYAIEAYQGYWTATYPAWVVGLFFHNTKISPSNASYVSGVGRDGAGDFHLSIAPGYGIYAEPSQAQAYFDPVSQAFVIGGNYGRIYFKSGGGSVGIQPKLIASDTLTLGRTYSTSPPMRWALYEAQAIGRRLLIGAAILYNVCKLDES